MKYSKQEVLQYVVEEDVKFIRLAFCDVFGNQKNISIMPRELPRAFEYGIAFDASAIAGFGDEAHSDLLLHPQLETLSLLPWRPEHGKVVRMFSNVSHPDGSVFEADTRNFLIKACEKADKLGYHFQFGAEQEFYLFKLDENGNPTKTPYDNAGYMDIAPEDRGENVRREICLTLEQMGIFPESSHHEQGPGQNEIDFHYSDALTAADDAMTFRTVVKTVARRNGLYADFAPKPIENKPGNGFHINFSVKTQDGSDKLPFAIAGILDKIRDMTVFLNPTVDSYKRFGHFKAPAYVTWSNQNRSQLIRVPAADGEYRRAELRSPDPLANPYLAFGLIIYAGLHGIQSGLELPAASDFNLYKAESCELEKFGRLPENMDQACAVAKDSSFIRDAGLSEILEIYCAGR